MVRHVLLAQGWTASAAAEALERDPHAIGRWTAAFGEGGPRALILEQTGPPLGEEERAELRAAVQELPATAGIGLANWNWKMAHQFVSQRFGITLCRSSCLNYLHRLGFAFKRPKKRLVKADEVKREIFVVDYAALREEEGRTGGKIFFASEVEWIELQGNSNGESSVNFLQRLRRRHGGRLNVIWDNAPAHRGATMRSYLETPGLNLRLVNLPGCSPDFNSDEAVWGWAREEATANLCLGSKTLVRERVSAFLDGLASRKDEVKRRCRTVLQSRVEAILSA